jgi:hypothetical protein
MDQNGPPVPPSDFLLWSAPGRTSENIDPPPELGRNDPPDGPSVAVYYRDEAEVRDGFLIALRAMGLAGLEQSSEPSTPPAGDERP